MVQAVLTLTPRIVLYSSEYTYYVINSLLIEFILFYFKFKNRHLHLYHFEKKKPSKKRLLFILLSKRFNGFIALLYKKWAATHQRELKNTYNETKK